MTRAARERLVFFWEEPIWLDAARPEDAQKPTLQTQYTGHGVTVVTPVLPSGMNEEAVQRAQRELLDDLMRLESLGDGVLWYYTPAALLFSDHLHSRHPVVYDCMDELSAFLGADPSLPRLERQLMDHADVMFTGGFSLYEAKRHHHPNVHPLPSGVDVEHFRPARQALAEPADQQPIPHPRLGFYGVIDERLDRALIAQLASLRPDWQIILVGPVAKVDPELLPRAANIHYLGGKKYQELPAYLSGWNVALMPFALNDATRFISPTKTPEYLAGGKPIVSTPIKDVVRHYGEVRAVRIADSAPAFAAAVEQALQVAAESGSWFGEVDEILAGATWEGIWSRMTRLIQEATERPGLEPARQARAQVA